MNWRDGESNPKILQHFASTTRPRRCSETRA